MTGKGNFIRIPERRRLHGARVKTLPGSLLEVAEGSMSFAIATHILETDVKVEMATHADSLQGCPAAAGVILL